MGQKSPSSKPKKKKEVSDLGLRSKRDETTPKWRRTVLCFAHGEGTITTIAMCYGRRVLRSRLLRYGQLEFVLRCVDFSTLDKIGRNDAKMTSYGAVLFTRGRGERDGCDVL